MDEAAARAVLARMRWEMIESQLKEVDELLLLREREAGVDVTEIRKHIATARAFVGVSPAQAKTVGL